MILQLGSSNSHVLNLEQVLYGLGYRGFDVDGEYDEKTKNVIENIQKTNGLTVDGIAGPQTFSVIDKIYQPEKSNFGHTASSVLKKGQEKRIVKSGYSRSKLAYVYQPLAERVKMILKYASHDGLKLKVTQGVRTFREQNNLYAIGRTRQKHRRRVTNARGGLSTHNYKFAVDFAVVRNGKITWDEKYYYKIGVYAQKAGLSWGGNWRFVDLPHVQIPSLPSVRRLFNYYNSVSGSHDQKLNKVIKRFATI